MVKKRQNFNLQELQRNRNETGFSVNVIRTSTVTLPLPHSHKCATEKGAVQAQTPPLKGGV